eukprot:785957-Rhodomonas_salina.1
MLRKGVAPDVVTYNALLDACAKVRPRLPVLNSHTAPSRSPCPFDRLDWSSAHSYTSIGTAPAELNAQSDSSRERAAAPQPKRHDQRQRGGEGASGSGSLDT